jgi:hypothetical protein
VANVLAPFGFQSLGLLYGTPPNFAPSWRKIAQADAVPVGQGDVVTGLATGYVTRAAAGGTSVAGVFMGCRYLSVAFKRTIWNNFWPGSDANGDVDVMIYDHPECMFKVQASAAAFTFADIGINFDYVNAAPNAGNGLSTMTADSASKAAATTTLPFRMWGLWSAYGIPGDNGTDDASNNNYLICSWNHEVFKTGRAGV